MRNSSSTDDEGKERDVAKAAGELDRGQRFEPERAAAFRRHALRRQRPRGRFEDIPVVRIAVRQRVLEVVGERPHLPLLDELNGRRQR